MENYFSGLALCDVVVHLWRFAKFFAMLVTPIYKTMHLRLIYYYDE